MLQNENDENSLAASTRLTRAKAAQGTTDEQSTQLKKPVQTLKVGTGTLTGVQRRRALGDVTNAAKAVEVAQDGKKAVTKTALLSKTTTQATQGVQKLSRTNSSRSALGVRDANAKPKATQEVTKSGSGSGVLGSSHKKRTQTSSSSTVVAESSQENEGPDGEVEERPRKKSFTQDALQEMKVQQQIDEEMDQIVEELDNEDLDDPSMCAEYVREIFAYYKELEKTTQPNASYMDHQDELEWAYRAELVDWLIEVHVKFRLLPETLFLAVNILDRFLSSKVVPLQQLQLVGVTAMFIASKYEEVLSPHVGNFVSIAQDEFKIEDVLRAERYTLSTLQYDLSFPNPMNFLRRISKADQYDMQTRTLGKYFLEVATVDHRFLRYPQSQIAAASMYLARMILDRGPWV